MPKLMAGVLALVLSMVGLVFLPGSAQAQTTGHPTLVSADPANNTPHVLDGEVFAVAQVGSKIILGGTFTRAQNAAGGAQLTRNRILAFDRATGVIDTSFAPNFNATVRTLVASPDGQSVYVGGQFGTMNGGSVPKILRLSTANGSRIGAFNPPNPNALVYDAKLSGNRLFVAGAFDTLGNQPRSKLAELDPTTGVVRSQTQATFAGVHRSGSTHIYKIDIAPDGRRLVAIGNFRSVNGQDRVQIAVFETAGGTTSLADWRTNRYEPNCFSSFDYYIRDVDFAPDSSYFVTTSTGGYGSGPPTLCDTVVRWETSTGGQSVQPTWIDYSGGDSMYAVATTGAAVYVGGHHRWFNNPFRGDAAGPGAVVREGIAALDPVNGLPLSWDPGRTRGRGVFDLLATSDGLWVGSDTDRIGNFEYHGRIAFMPLAGGRPVPQPTPPALPVDVTLIGGTGAGPTDPRYLYRVNAGGAAVPSVDGGPEWVGDGDSANPLRNSGSNAAGWSAVPAVDGTVPASTPRAVFASERWDPSGAPELEWNFPVPAGRDIEVRVYLANRCTCTASPGQRVFDVRLDGATVLDDIDLSAAVGHDVGTMRSFTTTSDGVVDLDFGHVVENPLVNAIEIIDLEVTGPPPPPVAAVERGFDGDAAGSPAPVTGVDWTGVQGTVWIDGSLYTAHADGTFARRAHDGTTFGNPTALNLYGLGAFQQDMQSMTSLFYDRGVMYFTLSGQSSVFSRYLTVESGIVGAQRFQAAPAGVAWSQVRGAFVSAGHLYWAHAGTGDLHRVPWSAGTTTGADTVVSGPAVDGVDWRARATFAVPGTGPNRAPTAAATGSCTGTSCTFDGTGSSDTDGSVTAWAWTLPGGQTATGPTVTRTLPTGQQTVGLTVTDDDGAQASTTVSVNVQNAPPTASASVVCSGTTCAFDGSGSSDPDSGVVSWDWDFGDGSGDSGEDVSHTYDDPGTYTVVLTVEDGAGATNTTTQSVTVDDTVAAVSFVGSAADGDAGSSTNHTVTVPGGVLAGDTLVMLLSHNGSSTVGVSDPAGWQRRRAVSATSMSTVLWTRTATAADAGSAVSATTSAIVRGSLVLGAYRGAQVQDPGTALVAETATTATHTTPQVSAPPGSWVLSSWTDKTASTTAWQVPSGLQSRQTGAGTGSGHLSWLLADSGGPTAGGTVGGIAATANSASRNATMATVVLAPAG